MHITFKRKNSLFFTYIEVICSLTIMGMVIALWSLFSLNWTSRFERETEKFIQHMENLYQRSMISKDNFIVQIRQMADHLEISYQRKKDGKITNPKEKRFALQIRKKGGGEGHLEDFIPIRKRGWEASKPANVWEIVDPTQSSSKIFEIHFSKYPSFLLHRDLASMPTPFQLSEELKEKIIHELLTE